MIVTLPSGPVSPTNGRSWRARVRGFSPFPITSKLNGPTDKVPLGYKDGRRSADVNARTGMIAKAAKRRELPSATMERMLSFNNSIARVGEKIRLAEVLPAVIPRRADSGTAVLVQEFWRWELLVLETDSCGPGVVAAVPASRERRPAPLQGDPQALRAKQAQTAGCRFRAFRRLGDLLNAAQQ